MRTYLMAVFAVGGFYLMLAAGACAIDSMVERGRAATVEIGP